MIIFFSIGAAFGAQALLRQQSEGRLFPLRLVTTTVFWPVVLFRILLSRIASSGDEMFATRQTKPGESADTRLTIHQKRLENELMRDSQDFPVFVWRDVISRYTGLSLALMYHDSDMEFGITRINGLTHDSKQAVCLQRRNHKLLEKHRTLAREDFIDLFRISLRNLREKEKAVIITKKYLKILKDQNAVLQVADICKNLEQIDDVISVPTVEQRPWVTQKQ